MKLKMRKPSVSSPKTSSVLLTLLITFYATASALVWAATASVDNTATDTSSNAETRENLLVIGDSLSAAYGLEVNDGWVALLQQRLLTDDYPVTVINSSISGDTSANGLSRLSTLLTDYQPGIVVIELGGNDGLRGLSLKQLKSNLAQMVEQSRAAGADVLLLGVQIPSNYGAAYTRLFAKTFVQVAEDNNASLVPFLLSGMETSLELFQSDGIHPAAEAQPLLLDNVWKELKPMLDKAYQ